MTQNAAFVPAVPGLCRALCRVFRPCAGCAGSPIGVRVNANAVTTRTKKHALMRICTRHTRHTRHIVDSYTFFYTSPGTHAGTPGTDTHARAPKPFIYSFKGKKMEETATPTAPQASRTIRCTPENARDMQQAVKNWPELHALVQQMQAQDLFPGLRALQITLTGPQSYVDQGLAALTPQNPAKRD